MPDRSERIYASYDMHDPLKWGLEQDYSRTTKALGEITVPAGFIWDGASTPRIHAQHPAALGRCTPAPR